MQFYESDAFLVNMIARFAVERTRRAASRSSSSRRKAHATALVDDAPGQAGRRRRGVQRSAGSACVDAHETLAAIMEHGHAECRTIRHGVRRHVLDGSSATAPRPPAIRVYGEMVDLLWKDGNARPPFDSKSCGTSARQSQRVLSALRIRACADSPRPNTRARSQRSVGSTRA